VTAVPDIKAETCGQNFPSILWKVLYSFLHAYPEKDEPVRGGQERRRMRILLQTCCKCSKRKHLAERPAANPLQMQPEGGWHPVFCAVAGAR
jgi:hypothetical protein